MLQIKDICKEYRTGSLVQKALDHVSLNLRDNEFVAILGPSGSGKTTLLNIIGGLDRYDSGDLVINGISTKKYKDRDWDSYRNHTIGFVFQSYNLIPHQTVLANVELALTISGVDKSERRKKAVAALEKVGLGEQLHKKPNQMSGGQMQRVAIARALVNDPDILLADEPTGALDSDTSIQVMDLLKEVAKDRLVVMVTHNPELAEEYATRIVNLRDGKIRSDTDPFVVDETAMEPPEHKNMGRSSMSLLTALSLSFNNLRTKKARTLLTSFAGSIGIIGIALILSLSTGVNKYIQSIEEETMSEYPLQIQSTGLDMTAMMMGGMGGESRKETGEVNVLPMVNGMFSTMDANDLQSLKVFLDSDESEIGTYTKAVEYSYDLAPQIYTKYGDKIRQVNPDRSFEAIGIGSASGSNSMMSMMMSTDVFYEMPATTSLYEGQYDVVAGRWPASYKECVVVLSSGGSISDFMLYTLGFRDPLELKEMLQQFINEENVTTPSYTDTYDYDDLLGVSFKLLNSSDYYQYDSQYKVWKDKTGDTAYMENLYENGEDIEIVGIVRPAEEGNGFILKPGIGYPVSLTEHVAEQAEQSEIVKQQMERPKINLFTNEEFGEERDKNGFEMESMFTVDEAALEKAFGMDSSAMSGGMNALNMGSFDLNSLNLGNAFSQAGNGMDLSGMMDLSQIQISLPEAPDMNLADMMGAIKITATKEDISKLAGDLLSGYQKYAKEHPEADYSGLSKDFMAYLKTEEGRKVLDTNMKEILLANKDMLIDKDDLAELIQEIMTGYAAYVEKMGYTDTENANAYLAEYLQTKEAQAIMDAWANRMMEEAKFVITQAQLEKLASELAAGYQNYAVTNGLPDPSKMGEHFMAYLSLPESQKLLSDGLNKMVDTSAVEKQMTQAIEGYMGQAMTAFGTAISKSIETQITAAMGQMMTQLANGMSTAMQQAMTEIGNSLSKAMNIDADAFADAFKMNMTAEEMTELMMSMNTSQNATYENNLKKLGYVDFAEPIGINIYPKDFDSKEQVVAILDGYNDRMEQEGKEDQVITYTDVVGSLMSSVTDIIDTISYVLIAFVAISLIVSSIMIGVITYISVLERKKEIGILRAIGASKHNISQVFNAETFIIGLCAGLIGIGLSLLILIPGNMIIHAIADSNDISAVLPAGPAVVLIILSVVLTLIGGLLPSKKAAKSDPVTALRTE